MKKHLKKTAVIFALALIFLIGGARVAPAGPGEVLFDFSGALDSAGDAALSFINVDVGLSAGYASINVIFPSELTFNPAAARPASWSVAAPVSQNDGITTQIINIASPSSDGLPNDIRTFLQNSNFTQAASGVYPAPGSKVSILLSETAAAVYIDDSSYMHLYEFAPGESSWLEAYNAAGARELAGLRGYLATVNSLDENIHLFNSFGALPGWIGGTRLRNLDNTLIGQPAPGSAISDNFSDYNKPALSTDAWYWACGPESGSAFYNNYDHSANGPISGEFSFFSNDETIAAYPSHTSIIDHSFQEPNNYHSDEYCLQFAQDKKASWNDLGENMRASEPLKYNKGFYVEYGGGLYTFADLAGVAVLEPHTVSFVVGNPIYTGIPIGNQTVFTGSRAAIPRELTIGAIYPQYGQALFRGWFKDQSDVPFNFAEIIRGNLTLYGRWDLLRRAADLIPAVPPAPTPSYNAYGAYNKPQPSKIAPPREPEVTAPSAPPEAAEIPGDVYTHEPYISGYGDGKFAPDRPITRAEAAAIFFASLPGAAIPDQSEAFKDVSPGAWYARAVDYMAETGALTGNRNGEFRPDSPITRAELTALACKTAELAGNAQPQAPPPPFGDVGPANQYYHYIASAYAAGWISGYPDNTFRPGALTTRAETVAFLNKFLRRALPKTNITNPPAPIFSDVNETHWAYFDILEAALRHDYSLVDGKERWETAP